MKTKTTDFVLIRGAEVFTPKPVGHKDVLTVHGRILAIGENLEAPPGFDVQTVDARHRLLLPGLVDGHEHIAGGGGEGGFQNRTPPARIESLVAAGVTTAVGLLGTDAVTRSVSSLLAEARKLQALGLSSHIYTGAYQLPTRTITTSVRQDLVLIGEVVGAGEIAIADDRGSHPSGRELIDLASEVHVGALLAGKKGVIQLHVGDDPEGLRSLFRTLARVHLPTDLFLPTHLNRRAPLLPEAVRYAKMGGYVDITSGIYPAPGDRKPVDPAYAMSELLHEGVPPHLLCMSSDSFGSSPVFDKNGHLKGVGIGHPETLWHFTREAVLHHRVPLSQALACITKNPASVIGLPHKGQIRVGGDADLLIVDEDLHIQGMFARGKAMMTDGNVHHVDPFHETKGHKDRMVPKHDDGASKGDDDEKS